MAGLEPPRPGTHDLMVATLASMGSTLAEVDVTELRDGTFIAELVVRNESGELRISSRPSDAVALAVRCGAPVFAADAVLGGRPASSNTTRTSPSPTVTSSS